LPKHWKTEEEIGEAINLLMARMASIQAPSVEDDIRSESMNIKVVESGFRHTILEVFGQDSPEYREYGHLEMLQGPLRIGISKAELVAARLKGREYMAALCVELITRLQEKILSLRRRTPSRPAPTGLHERIDAATSQLLASGHPWEAVFAASKALILLVKERSGRHDLDGAPLMRNVFSKNNPILRFNQLTSPTDFDEQEGMMHLFEGAVMALRNPGGHAFPNGPESRAVQYIELLSLLAHKAEEAHK
jgi:uncharacterized protein (TIGR02391 family)